MMDKGKSEWKILAILFVLVMVGGCVAIIFTSLFLFRKHFSKQKVLYTKINKGEKIMVDIKKLL